MGQALYRKYRSRNLGEIVGQKPITTALANALKNGQISHAYLFTGPRGVGKTSIARILAYEINGLEYKNDELPIDIIEIDAASNRRIDEIRDLREKVRIAPISAKYKVYIIDEVHMLTREAFNALLKTLEEPPAHVIFILATTEAHKLPETIISRTQRYSFKLVPVNEIVELLRNISNKEDITIDDESLRLIANHSDGSLRDAISLLDQIRHSNKNVTAEDVRQSFGLPPAQLISKLLNIIKTANSSQMVELLQQARDDGVSANLIARLLIQEIRQTIIKNDELFSINIAISLVQALLLVETSNQPEIQLELALIGAQIDLNTTHKELAGKTNGKLSTQKVTNDSPPLMVEQPTSSPETKTLTVDSSILNDNVVDISSDVLFVNIDIWNKALDSIKKGHNTLYGIVRMAKPEFSATANNEQGITLYFDFPFHLKRVSEQQNKQIIIDTLKNFGITKCELHCILSPKDKLGNKDIDIQINDIETAPEVISQIRNIFGEAEVIG